MVEPETAGFANPGKPQGFASRMGRKPVAEATEQTQDGTYVSDPR